MSFVEDEGEICLIFVYVMLWQSTSKINYSFQSFKVVFLNKHFIDVKRFALKTIELNKIKSLENLFVN